MRPRSSQLDEGREVLSWKSWSPTVSVVDIQTEGTTRRNTEVGETPLRLRDETTDVRWNVRRRGTPGDFTRDPMYDVTCVADSTCPVPVS